MPSRQSRHPKSSSRWGANSGVSRNLLMKSYMNETYTSHFEFERMRRNTDIGVPDTPNGSTITNAGARLVFCGSKSSSVFVIVSLNSPHSTSTVQVGGKLGR